MNNNAIQHSIIESNILGLKVGRLDCNTICEKEILDSIKKHNYQLIRVKTSNLDEYASLKLSNINLPFYYVGSIRKYIVDCYKSPLPPFTSEEITFEQYEPSKSNILYDLLKDTWGDYPIGYYRLPRIHEMVTKEMEIDCLFEYYKDYFPSDTNNSKLLWFMKSNEVIIGFFALTVMENKVDSTIAGIYKKHQNSGLFYNILRKIRSFCIENNLQYFQCGARSENPYSQKAFEQEYMQYYGGDNVFCIINL